MGERREKRGDEGGRDRDRGCQGDGGEGREQRMEERQEERQQKREERQGERQQKREERQRERGDGPRGDGPGRG
ncbi:MAG: hypothetical protein H0U91_05855 [Rubrobacter sp.]|nr:hypothetical protein [Rubrobacter sp.]